MPKGVPRQPLPDVVRKDTRHFIKNISKTVNYVDRQKGSLDMYRKSPEVTEEFAEVLEDVVTLLGECKTRMVAARRKMRTAITKNNDD